MFSCALESLEIASSILLLVFHVLVNPLLGANLENFLVVALNKLPQLRLVTSGYCNTHTQLSSSGFTCLPFRSFFFLSPFSSLLFLRKYACMTLSLSGSLYVTLFVLAIGSTVAQTLSLSLSPLMPLLSSGRFFSSLFLSPHPMLICNRPSCLSAHCFIFTPHSSFLKRAFLFYLARCLMQHTRLLSLVEKCSHLLSLSLSCSSCARSVD